ncbi:MAG: alpha-galactosidase, partial [Prevotellaceae bacterium]|nr:alpha-galactosidase [Prevotellaceae bacterium]
MNNTNRRKFLKHTATGTIALAGLSVWDQVIQAATRNSKNNLLPGTDTEIIPSVVFADWLIAFDEKTATLTLKNSSLALSGKLTFVSGDEIWAISRSRDGVPGRYALVNPQGNVQGYFVFLPNGSRLQLLFYHRTAQAYPGTLSYTGNIAFFADAFPCRTQATVDERVLALSAGKTNSLLNDSLFSPEKDCALQLQAANLQIYADGNGKYTFSLSGRIEETAEAVFSINPETDYFRRRYVPYYRPIDRKRTPKAPTGWMSWNTYFDKADAEDNLNEAKIGKKYLQPFGCEFWSVESWQGNSDKLPVCDFYNMDLEVNEKQFPKGMKHLADDIRALGFRPGLWMAPFGTGNAEFYKAHKSWFLHNRDGAPIRSWNGQ